MALGLRGLNMSFVVSLTQSLTPHFENLHTKFSVAEALNRPAVDTSASASVHLEQPKITVLDGDRGSFVRVDLLCFATHLCQEHLSHTLCLLHTSYP